MSDLVGPSMKHDWLDDFKRKHQEGEDMSRGYYLQQQSEFDRDKLLPGTLIGVRSWTKPGPTFTWAINPYKLVGFAQNFVWIKSDDGQEMSFASFVVEIQMCKIQKWHFEEIPV